jgi:NodT family efflux transporter outer membrane factor (OMF) lipoprotein
VAGVRLAGGYANRSDVAVQEAALAQIQATLPPLRKALAIQRDLISALAGRFPSQEPRETFRLADLRMPTDLPVSLPAQLVRQRPDVRSSEELLHSASANIGVAVANMLPSLTLAAGRGYTATGLGSLFTGPNIFWSVAGSATQPLFDGFKLLHLERAAVALYEQAAWNYRNTVVGAFQNVADSLRAIQNDADALKASRDFEKAAKVSLDLAQQQMQTGNADVLLLLNAQVTCENAVIQVVQAQANRVSDTATRPSAAAGGTACNLRRRNKNSTSRPVNPSRFPTAATGSPTGWQTSTTRRRAGMPEGALHTEPQISAGVLSMPDQLLTW